MKIVYFFIFFIFFQYSLLSKTIRVATFNVNNYLQTDRLVDGVYLKNYPKPESEKESLRQAIHLANPDVIALQEMGSKTYLKELQKDLSREGLSYPHSDLIENASAKRHLAILSKLPFQTIFHHEIYCSYFNQKTKIDRGLLEVTFNTNETNWTLFILHLKSRLTLLPKDKNSDIRREKEARAIRDFIAKKYPLQGNPLYLIVGDFNDTVQSKPLQRFFQKGKIRLSYPLCASDSRSEHWTYYCKKRDVYERIDFILASPAFKAYVKIPPQIIDNALSGSDHRLLYVDLYF